MEFLLETNKVKGCPLGLLEMKKAALLTLKESRLPVKNRRIAASIAFVSSGAMQDINRQYRHKNQVTDILSFGEYATSKKLLKDKSPIIFLGELIICCAFVKKSAKINKLSFEEEFRYIFSHGILHLLGFDHGEKMFSIQDRVAEKLK